VRRRRQLRQVVSALAAVSVFAGGCTDEPDPFPTAASAPAPVPTEAVTLAPEPLPSPTVSAIDVSVVPPVDQMTIEYVEAVVNAIEAESGKLFATVLAEPVNPLGATPAGTIEGLEALFGADRLQLKIEEAEAFAESDASRKLAVPAEVYVGVRFVVLQVSYVEPGCMIALAELNRDGSAPSGGNDTALFFVSLGLASDAGSPMSLNPTAWVGLKALPNRSSDGSLNTEEFGRSATLGELDGVLPHDCSDGEASRVA
jgi:hypothetical protein